MQTFLNAYNNAILALVKQGITQAVLLSTNTQQKALNAFTRFEGKEVDSWRKETARAFIESRMKRDHGLNLSDRVWNYTQQTKSEFEVAVSQVLSNGIGKGISAESLARQVRQYLKNPDMMYRRYHLKKLQSDGTKIDVVEWRRRVVDKEGKVHFVKEDLERVGTGVYRSARQNALRLTITETNMAYNYSNCKRWESEPFVLGLRIRLSANHPEEDICDELAGDYPKTFMWRGWHPRCMCSISPILMDRNSEEWKKLRKMPKDEYETYQSPNLIKDVPSKFSEWCKRNEKKLKAARKNDKLPYFVRDNEKVVGDIVGWKDEKEARRERILEAAKKRHAARTPEKEAMLREYWAKKVAEAEARRRHEAIMEAARIRHATRTPEQIADIKQRAEARLKKHDFIKRTADNILNIASKYKVNTIKLKKYINEGNLDAMLSETKKITKKIIKVKSNDKALNKEYKGSAIGRDISLSIDTTKMISEDPYLGTFTNNVARMQGFDRPAKLVSEEEFERLAKKFDEVFYRTVSPTTFKGRKMTSTEFASQLYKAERLELNGDGGRLYGDGIYTATSAWNGFFKEPLSEKSRNYAFKSCRIYGKDDRFTLEMTWTRKPKIIMQEDLINTLLIIT